MNIHFFQIYLSFALPTIILRSAFAICSFILRFWNEEQAKELQLHYGRSTKREQKQILFLLSFYLYFLKRFKSFIMSICVSCADRNIQSTVG